ncbi:MAG: PHP domain-containing protein [Clostridia bacterium]|nr:PHP domain-containing protein [Clostridia bacterium]
MLFQAHKGVSTENPENTMAAFEAAIRQGYGLIELDPGVTADDQVVVLHDKSINRTARNPDGSEIDSPKLIGELTYAQALEYDFGVWFSKKFAGTRLPLLRDALELARSAGVGVKIDNKYQHFSPREQAALFAVLADFPETAMLTCGDAEELLRVHDVFPQMQLHYDGPVDEPLLKRLSAAVGRERLTVWLPHPARKKDWIKVAYADAELVSAVHRYAKLGIWILQEPQELADAVRWGADVIETNGQLKPEKDKGRLCDLHNHSEYSHDSVCRIEDMAQAHAKRNVPVMAMTDHCDVYSWRDYDIFTPLLRAADDVKRLNGTNGMQLLSGLEISEGFWFEEQGRKAESLAPWDVILGSVHCVRFRDLTKAYSKIDFGSLPTETVYAYLNAYFDDVQTLLDWGDFDVLAHLTCPLRYICGKYRVDLDLSVFDQKIEAILRGVIRKGIVLEVNTSGYEDFGFFMPDRELLIQYRSLGGYLVSLGSDAHKPEQAARSFDAAVSMLRELGFSFLCRLEHRTIVQSAL